MKTLVLGMGFVGEWFCKTHTLSQATSRNPSGIKSSKLASGQQLIEFQLSRRETWKNIPAISNVLWTFPAASDPEEVNCAVEFFSTVLLGRNVLVLGSTSAYESFHSDEKITEESKLKMEDPRVKAEENIRQLGASVLHLAGIFGENRDPLSWVQRGMIKNGASYVNLIHVRDILRTAEAWFKNPLASERLNLSNGKPKRWNQIVEELKVMKELSLDFKLPESWPPQGSKQIVIGKICLRLGLEAEDFLDFPCDLKRG